MSACTTHHCVQTHTEADRVSIARATVMGAHQRASTLHHKNPSSRPASAHSSIRSERALSRGEGGEALRGQQPPLSSPASPQLEIYDDHDDSGGEGGRDSVVEGADGVSRLSPGNSTPILGSVGGGYPLFGGGGGRGVGGGLEKAACAGMVSVDVRVEGCYNAGEKDLLQALRSVGFETSFSHLRDGGIQVVDDLVKQHLDDARIAWLCPNLSAVKRKVLVERTEAARRDGFLSRNAQVPVYVSV